MMKSIAILALAAAASAQVTKSLYLVGFDQQALVGSVIASDSAATTYSIACSDPDSDDCGVPTSFTFTQGPSTVHYRYVESDSPDDNETVDLGCTITSSMSGSCVVTTTGVADGMAVGTSSTASFSNMGDALGGQVVTVTAGLAVAASTAASTTTGGQSASVKSSSSSTAGVPRVTGAHWVVGAAGALALAAL